MKRARRARSKRRQATERPALRRVSARLHVGPPRTTLVREMLLHANVRAGDPTMRQLLVLPIKIVGGFLLVLLGLGALAMIVGAVAAALKAG